MGLCLYRKRASAGSLQKSIYIRVWPFFKLFDEILIIAFLAYLIAKMLLRVPSLYSDRSGPGSPELGSLHYYLLLQGFKVGHFRFWYGIDFDLRRGSCCALVVQAIDPVERQKLAIYESIILSVVFVVVDNNNSSLIALR
jgi:hypothetical protein